MSVRNGPHSQQDPAVGGEVRRCTAFSELTDPVIGRERLTEQFLHATAGDLEAIQLDEDFLRARLKPEGQRPWNM